METQTLLLQSLFMSWGISEKSFQTKDSTHSLFNNLLLFFLLSDCQLIRGYQKHINSDCFKMQSLWSHVKFTLTDTMSW